MLCSTIFHLIIHCLLAETELAHKKEQQRKREEPGACLGGEMQKDIWQPWLNCITCCACNKMYFARKYSSFALPASRSTLLSTWFGKRQDEKKKKMSNLLHSKLRLGVLILVDKNMTYIFSIRLSLDKRSVGQTFLRFLAFSWLRCIRVIIPPAAYHPSSKQKWHIFFQNMLPHFLYPFSIQLHFIVYSEPW